MPANDSLKRLGGGRWETRDGRFAIEPQSGTWVIVDQEQTDELGLPLVRGPFGSLTAAKAAIEAARSEGPKASPLADRIEQARKLDAGAPKADTTAPKASTAAASMGSAAGGPAPATAAASSKASTPTVPVKPESPPEPRWLRELGVADQRRARDLLKRLDRMGVDNAERVVRAEVADGEPALARLAIERALRKAVDGSKDTRDAVRAVVRSMLRGAEVELGVSWKLVGEDGRRIERVDLPE